MSAMVRICKNRWMAYAIAGLLSLLSYFIGPSFSIKSAGRIKNTVSFSEVKLARFDTKERCIIPAARACEKGNFNHLVPAYDAEENVAILNGDLYSFLKDVLTDWDEDGTKESKLERFVNSKGQGVIRFTVDAKTWAWGIYNRPSEMDDALQNYVLLNSKGNGFDQRYEP